MYNDASTESTPTSSSPSSGESTLIATPASVVTTDVRPVMSVLTSTTSRQNNVQVVSDCSIKQTAPQMEHVIEEREMLSTPRSTTSPLTAMRFVRVTSVVQEDAPVRIPSRNSCLKRSSSYAISACCEISDAVEVPIVSIAHEIEPSQKNKRRCWTCNIKIGLTAVTCRCDYTFCNKHRYAEEHNCQFNFKSVAKRKLEQENPQVIPAKFARMI